MISEFDASEFVDEDLKTMKPSDSPQARSPRSGPAPSAEEVESQVSEMQRRLSELKKAQQDLEHERATLEETRRRQAEFSIGRQEMLENLTHGVGLLEEAEVNSRRETEQLAKHLADLREALEKLEAIDEDSWAKESLAVELTRACTTVDNARMEWNSARVKFAFLNGPTPTTPNTPAQSGGLAINDLIQSQNYAELCKLGLALTWPVAIVGLALFLLILLRAG